MSKGYNFTTNTEDTEVSLGTAGAHATWLLVCGDHDLLLEPMCKTMT